MEEWLYDTLAWNQWFADERAGKSSPFPTVP
jgi:hypothetical protein